jgi:predicted enzyme related to lactoylglutathione lyase
MITAPSLRRTNGKENYGSAGALANMEGKDPGESSILLYFRCDDCATEADRPVENGGRVHASKMTIGQYSFIALVYDTEGTMICIHPTE